ncbi:MAG: type VI secretion system protein TssA [Holosporales bacterium]|jgi:type VI secretion system protein ImpA|nr:type VI secretion system protein TssA [Holosporales bacterium]
MLASFKEILDALPSDGPGKDLKYDPIYDKIRNSRSEEEAYLSMGIWERELKKADWEDVQNLCVNVLKKETCDLQIVCWLCEAWCHLEGWNGLKTTFLFFNKFCQNHWDKCYPLITEEDSETNIEHRVRILEWFVEKIGDSMMFFPFNKQNPITPDTINLAVWHTALNIDAVERRSGRAQSENSNTITLKRFRQLLKQIPIDYIQHTNDTILSIEQCIADSENFFLQKCNNQEPAFTKIKNLLEDVKKICNFALPSTPNNQEQIEIIEPPEIVQENLNKNEKNFEDISEIVENTETQKKGQIVGQTSEEGVTISGKNDAYKALSDLADFLLEIDPQSPGPYIVKLVANWGEKNLPELMEDIATGTTHGHKVLRMISEIVKKT